MMRSQIETGMPYIAFKDTLNKYNPNKHDGVIVGTNLCTESHSNVKPTRFDAERIENGKIIREMSGGLVHVCNLVSINLANVDSDEELESICRTSVRILDNAIDFTEVPILEGRQHNLRYRTIGVGAMGLADHLAKNNIPYINSADYVDELFEKWQFTIFVPVLRPHEKKERLRLMRALTGKKGLLWANASYGLMPIPNIKRPGTTFSETCRNTAFAIRKSVRLLRIQVRR